jgi:hypothetical protein
MSTSQQPSSCLLNESTAYTTNKPSEPIVESSALDSIVMVPFFRIPDRHAKGCNDGDYRYVSAAKYLGFHKISDRND